jgi:hypothetical protein
MSIPKYLDPRHCSECGVFICYDEYGSEGSLLYCENCVEEARVKGEI